MPSFTWIGKDWVLKNLVEMLGILINCFIAYHVYFLSKRLSNKERLDHKEKIKQKAEDLLAEISRKNCLPKFILLI